MSPPVDPVMRFDQCFAVLGVTDVRVGAHETKCLSGYIHLSWHGNPQGEDSPSLMQHYGLCPVF